jgi:hypothetical protein
MGRGTLGFVARQTARVEREGSSGLGLEAAGLRGEQAEGGLRATESVAMALLALLGMLETGWGSSGFTASQLLF